MTRELYLRDPYLREFDARIVRNSGREVLLDKTAFYPGGSGQPPDKGELSVGPVNAKVIEVRRVGPDPEEEDYEEDYEDGDPDGPHGASGGEEIVHVLDNPIPGTVREVHATLDWPRRHRNMRFNTALALLSGVVGRDLGATSSVGRIRSSRARLDLTRFTDPSLTLNDAVMRGIETSVNEMVASGRDVAEGEISGAASGGLYVKDTSEVGGIELTRWYDRGSRGVRLEFTLADLTGHTETEDGET